MLQGIVDRGIAHQVEIHYNTNGTQYPEQAENIWKHFKTVEIAFSIDDIGKRFEYQRTNANWDLVRDNILKFKILQSQYNNIQLQVCSTVNIFNVMYLETLALWNQLQDFDFIYWNMMHEAYYFSIATLPEYAKETAKERLLKADVDASDRQEFNRIIDFMDRGVSLDGNIMLMKIKDLDQRRKQDLRDHHPELATAIGYHGPN
jgi:hypothetical protein